MYLSDLPMTSLFFCRETTWTDSDLRKKLTLVGFGVSYTIGISLRSIKEYIHWKYDGFMWSITYFLPKKE